MLKKIDQDELIPILEETGIKAKEYANPRSVGTPIEFFLTTIPGGKGILIKKGEKIGLKIATDKEHRQAVLSVHEGKRTITRTVKFSNELVKGSNSSESRMRQEAKNKFNMAIPGATITVSDIKETGRKELTKGNEYNAGTEKVYYTATVTATVNKVSTNTFLMGMDETSHFIAILPKDAKVESVKDAHKFLKPHGVGAGSKRQGEFFFVPTNLKFSDDKVRNSVPLERGSNHHAQFGIPKKIIQKRRYSSERTRYEGATYVKGLIYDKRGYRHAPVDLGMEKWHKVVRNKEVNTTLNPSRRVTRYD